VDLSHVMAIFQMKLPHTNPLVVGQMATSRIVKQLYLLKMAHCAILRYLMDGFEFCKVSVEPNGITCPIKGDYDFTTNFPVEKATDDPINTSIEYDIRTLG
jgi:hypothetical protein